MINEYQPNAIIFAHTFNGEGFCYRLAQKLEAGLATDVIKAAPCEPRQGVLFTRSLFMPVKESPGWGRSNYRSRSGYGSRWCIEVAESAGAGAVVKPAIAAYCH